MASSRDAQVNVLVKEMGFPLSEAVIALRDCQGNMESAVTRLSSGEYAPPPYAEIEKDTQVLDKNGPTCAASQANLYPDLNPPPYTKMSLKAEIQGWERDCPATFFKLNEVQTEEIRCSSCFDVIQDGHEKSGVDNKAVKDGMRNYHYDCFMKTRGPRCAHCCFPLSKIDLDRNLCGQFIIFEGKKYHVECYEKFAAPRCSYCFNVIIETPGNEFSGKWIRENNKTFHGECFYKKKASEVKQSKYT